jgi:hypothetical protein
MKTFMTAKLPLFLLLAVCPLTARAETIHLEAEQMTLVLPDGWVEIPEQIRIQRVAELEKSLAKPKTLKYTHVFQPLNVDWFSYPYVIVEPQNERRFSEADLHKIPGIDWSKMGDRAKEYDPKVLSSVSIGKLVYDPVSRKAWTQSKITANGLNVEALIMMQITQLGTINFGFYQTAEQFEEWFPLFMKIATSVTPDPEIAYRPD